MKMREGLENLMKIPDEAFGAYSFSREPLREKISGEQQRILTAKAIRCGREYGAKMEKDYGKIPALVLAGKLGAAVEMKSRPAAGSCIVFAQFTPPSYITVFTDCLERARERIQEQKLEDLLTVERIQNILIAHEVFHCVEEIYKKEIFTQTERIELWRLGRIRNRSPILCLGEIAAMAFARQTAGLNYSPFVLDWFLVSLYDEKTGNEIYEDFGKLRRSF